MDKQPNKPSLTSALAKHFSAPLAGVALSALSAWMIVIGVKGLAGFTVNQQTALADLLGIVVITGAARWIALRHNAK